VSAPFDVIVAGAGHNGLACAALLARGGLRVLVLERRDTVGGAAVTEPFHPGFRVSSLSHAAGPLRPSLVRRLALARHGLALIEPETRVFAPLPDGRGLRLCADPARSAEALRPFSARDAGRFPVFDATLRRTARALAGLLAATPPDVDAPAPRDLLPLLGAAVRLRRLGKAEARALLRYGPMAVADFAGEWFESEPLRALVCARGLFGALAGPRSAGTTARLLLRDALEGGSGAGATVFVRGGLGALSDALAASARAASVTIRTGAPVERFLARDERVTGVVLAGGEEIEARAVVSALDPKRTFLDLLDPVLLDPDDLWRLRNYRQQGMAAKVHLALDALPEFKGVAPSEAASVLAGRIHVGDDVDTLERAHDDAKYGAPSRRPYLEATIPTLSDPALAPGGCHVMSVYVQFAPYRLRAGDWDARRDELGDTVLRTLEEYAPGLTARVLARQVLTPLDLERTYGLTGGHPMHGEMALDQLFTMRPLMGFARYRAPVAGLYLCGAGTHPGGGVTGAPGHNAAREVLRDLKRRQGVWGRGAEGGAPQSQ
jgi:phytoene dehydrogenase-like protein